MDGNTGYWSEDDSNGEVAFLLEFEDTFWVFDDTAWMARRFAGRRFRKGQPKGKGKGKGAKGNIPFHSI